MCRCVGVGVQLYMYACCVWVYRVCMCVLVRTRAHTQVDIKALKDDLWTSVDRINPANKAPPKGRAAPKTVPVEFMGEKKEALPFSVPLTRECVCVVCM